MSRSVKEWIGKTDDSPIPPRVKVRIFLTFNGTCQCGCTRKIQSYDKWECDHKVALINGGENRETNLIPLLTECHRSKTNSDLRLKSVSYRKIKKSLGLKKSANPLPGSRASPWKRTFNRGWVKRST